MDADSSTNLVAFEVRAEGRLQTLIGRGPTRSAHAIELAWDAVAAGGEVQPGDVRQVYSEWQPSSEDQAFLERIFPGAAVTYSFVRPEGDDEGEWERALEAAAGTIERSLRRKWWQFWG